MITKQDLEDYRFREIALEQQFAKLKMWQNRLTRLNTTYGLSQLGYRSDCTRLQAIVDEIETHIPAYEAAVEKVKAGYDKAKTQESAAPIHNNYSAVNNKVEIPAKPAHKSV